MAGRYNQIKTMVDNIEFDSKSEALRYSHLLTKVKIGEISNLQLQVRFDVILNKVRVCKYIADFVYTTSSGKVIVEDVKNAHLASSPLWRLKAKLFKAMYGYQIKVVDSRNVLGS